MKGLAGLGATAFIAAAVAFWFMAKPIPAVVSIELRPLTPSSTLPTFKRLADDPQFAPVPQKTR
jgi:hypothetical protein